MLHLPDLSGGGGVWCHTSGTPDYELDVGDPDLGLDVGDPDLGELDVCDPIPALALLVTVYHSNLFPLVLLL